MPASAIIKVLTEVTGLGNDKQASCRAALSDVPTQASGPLTMVLTTAQQLIDTLSLITGELTALYIKAHSGAMYVDPFTTAAAVSACCYLAEGACNVYTYETTVSAKPSIIGAAAGNILEYLIAGTT
jgi:hypothetical protein